MTMCLTISPEARRYLKKISEREKQKRAAAARGDIAEELSLSKQS